eukprot:TRINITY_DN1990_c0_g1_i2.p1 TRINITY_DN1990_c0_g1~~TRINITY_DN1990_c0_g1_i2.p1  ORF type:complete len:379 (-),score=66.19 TRINITY_DN1990_c0_g1_i2:109-1245(-)
MKAQQRFQPLFNFKHNNYLSLVLSLLLLSSQFHGTTSIMHSPPHFDDYSHHHRDEFGSKKEKGKRSIEDVKRFATFASIPYYLGHSSTLESGNALLAERKLNDCKVIDIYDDTYDVEELGLLAVAIECEKTKEIVLSFRGTVPWLTQNLIVNAGILSGGIEHGIEESFQRFMFVAVGTYGLLLSPLAQLGLSFLGKSAIIKDFQETLQPYMKNAEKEMHRACDNAEKFFHKIQAHADSKDHKLIVVGHSLAGYYAQKIGSLHGVETHTFNSPGVKQIIPESVQIKGEKVITNHMRRNDIVGGFGYHIGKIVLYDDWKEKATPSSSKARKPRDVTEGASSGWLIKVLSLLVENGKKEAQRILNALANNHSIENFINDLK